LEHYVIEFSNARWKLLSPGRSMVDFILFWSHIRSVCRIHVQAKPNQYRCLIVPMLSLVRLEQTMPTRDCKPYPTNYPRLEWGRNHMLKLTFVFSKSIEYNGRRDDGSRNTGCWWGRVRGRSIWVGPLIRVTFCVLDRRKSADHRVTTHGRPFRRWGRRNTVHWMSPRFSSFLIPSIQFNVSFTIHQFLPERKVQVDIAMNSFSF